jgi:hypothetical protein
VIIPSALADGTAARWPLASVMPPLAALATAPASARAHVHAVLPAWHQASLAHDTATVVSELVTNAVQASTTPAGEPAYTGGRIAVVRLRLLSDGQRVLAEVWDQAPGVPAPRRAGSGDENGRGLQLVNALTRGRWGWQPAGSQPKIVWAELSAELPGASRDASAPARKRTERQGARRVLSGRECRLPPGISAVLTMAPPAHATAPAIPARVTDSGGGAEMWNARSALLARPRQSSPPST